MTSDTIFCQGCGITLRPFMNRCPRCGTARMGAIEPQTPGVPAMPTDDEPVVMAPLQTVNTGALPFRATASAAEAAPAATPQHTTIVPFDGNRRRALRRDEAAIAPPPDSIFMSPPDTVRRFPLLNSSQWMLVMAALALLLVGLVIGYLLWSREQKDKVSATLTTNSTLAPSTEPLLPSTVPTIDPLSASPTPELVPMVEGDQAIFAEVKRGLAAYNPIYHSRYQVAVKDGVVTVTGPADNQPEKDGVSNVVKLVAGVKGVTNNLTIKADPAAAQGGLPMTTTSATQTIAPTVTPAPENSPANQQAALEAERQRLAREAETQRQREAEYQRQRDADNQRLETQRQREDEQRRQREEAERARFVQAPPVPAPVAPRVLRSGTVAWSGIVDGVDEIVITGGSASVRHQSGEGVREARTAFSAPIPRAPVALQLMNSNGRGSIQIVQEPSAANGYTTIVRIDDSRENGGKPYQFTLRWTAQ